jgi:thioredoxin reductase
VDELQQRVVEGAWLALPYAGPALLAWWLYLRRRRAKERASRERLDESREARLLEPPSLHPHINPNKCGGCAACVDACPEHDAPLGLIDGKAVLVSPASCIGHGACKDACPFDAITLVFGTETRGVEIPNVGPDFQTNVPGVYIAGELGGMGLIRNASEQGRQAIDSIARAVGGRHGFDLDVLIVGAGPAGIAATLAAKAKRLRAVTIEQETLGGAVAHYPRGKIVMTAPLVLPLYGKVKLGETRKEALLELWRAVERKTQIAIRYHEQLESVKPGGGGFEVVTSKQTYRTRSLLLCIGRRGTPRKLGVPGEEQSKVVYRLAEPDQYAGRRVLVVGGGDSALEAAAVLAQEVPRTTVALSYRGLAFDRAKSKNRARVQAAEAAGKLRVLLGSQVREILPDRVRLTQGAQPLELPNDAVIVCAGGTLPTPLLTSIGIQMDTKYGTA